jgi:hypothetical protein
MQMLTRVALALSHIILLVPPPIIVIAGAFATMRMSKRKWVVHLVVFTALFFSFPLYIWIESKLDPTSIEYPGPGDGLAFLFYLFLLLPSALVYSVYAWFSRTKCKTVGSVV